MSGEVWVVIGPNGAGGIDLEVLDSPPRWNLDELGQQCFVGNVNGGDSRRWRQSGP